jgi:polysaccharide biosynthesis transport protein
MDFAHIIGLLKKRIGIILLSTVGALILTWGATRIMGTKWTATVDFVSTQNSTLGTGQDAGDGFEGAQAAQTQAIIYTAIVKSQDVAEPTQRALHLDQLPADVVGSLQFTATGSRLYQLKVTARTKPQARAIANALADNFVRVNHALRTHQAQTTEDLLQQQLHEADQQLAQARRHYDDYRNAHHVVGDITMALDAAVGQLRAAHQQEEQNAQKLADLQARLIKVRAEIAPTSKPELKSASTLAEATNPGEALIQTQLDKVHQQLAELNDRYTEEMPAVRRAKDEEEKLTAQLRLTHNGGPTLSHTAAGPEPRMASLQQEERLLTQEIAGLQAASGAIKQSVADAQREIDQYKGVDSPAASMAADLAALSDGRASLALRARNASMLKDVAESQDPITVIDHVNDFNPPLNTSTNKIRLMILGGMVALLATVGITISTDKADRRIRTVQQAEIVLPAPIVAAIPQPTQEMSDIDLARVTQLFPFSFQAETFRFLALHLLNQPDPPIRSMLICSARAKQGTTTALTNLGITLAQAGKRVILVDANIRTAALHQVFGMCDQYGYTNLLQHPDETTLALVLQPTEIDNLQVICSGPLPANPWELFRSQNMQRISELLLDRADYVLYDTPASVLFTDALNLAPIVDAAFLCARALQPAGSAEVKLINLLQDADVPVLGYVLNDVPAAVVEGYHTYQHYYAHEDYTPIAHISSAGAQERIQ